MKRIRRARLALILLPAIFVALAIAVPSFLLAASDSSGSSAPLSPDTVIFSSSPSIFVSSASYINYNPDGPIFSNQQPAAAASDVYQAISVSYSDPDGVVAHGWANGPQIWYDGYETTKCSAVGMHWTATGMWWDHYTVTQWNPVGCSALAAEFLPMSDGTHTVRVKATDKLGNSNTLEWTFSMDHTAPAVTPSALCGTIAPSATPTISFTYSDASGIDTSSAVMKLDGVTVTAAAGPAEAVYTPGQALADGVHTAIFEIKDSAGNKGSAICGFTVDTQAPQVTSLTPADGSVVNTASPLVSAAWSDTGAGADQYTAHLTLDGGDVTAGATVTQYGLTYQTGNLAQGSHTVSVYVSDKTGKQSSTRSSTFIFSNDTQAPLIDSLTPADGSLVQIANPLIQAAWHDPDSAGVDQYSAHLTLDGADVTAGATADQYGISYQAGGLSLGSHTISLYVKDKVGHQSLTRSSTFNYSDDTQAPVVDGITPANGDTVNTTDPLIKAAWHDLGSSGINQTSAHLTLDGADVTAGATVTADGLSYQASGLGLGVHTVSVYVKDNIGHQSDTLSSAFTYSVFNPDGPTFSDEHPAVSTNDPLDSISVSYSDPDGVASHGTANGPQMWFDGYEVTKCYAVGVHWSPAGISWDHTVVTKWGSGCSTLEAVQMPMTDGDHTVRVIATDSKGNKNMKEWTFSIDHTPPAITPSALCGTVVENATPEIRFAYQDQYGVNSSSASMKLDGVAAAISPGAAETVYTPAPLGDGPHTAVFEVYDNAGNKGTSTCTFTVDTQPPVIDSLTPVDGGFVNNPDPLISAAWTDYGAGVDQYTAHLELDGADVSGGAALGQYGLTYAASGLSLGDHTVSVSVRDKTGKQSATSTSTFTYMIDNDPPVIDSLTPVNGAHVENNSPLISAAWSDYGSGIDPGSASLLLDGKDVTAGATVDGNGLTYQAAGLAQGSHTIKLFVKDRVGLQSATVTSTFVYSMTYYAPWYDSKPENGMKGNWILVINQEDTPAPVDIYIGNEKVGSWTIAPGDRITPQFPGRTSGPVKVVSTAGNELLVSQRVLFKDSFNEVMAVRDSDLDSDYRFTWYDSRPENGMNGNWILIGNADNSSAVVDVYIGSTCKGTYTLPPGGIATPTYAGMMDGSVRVKSRGGQKLIVSQRVIYKNAFSEVMGTGVSDLDKEYFFTWYDSKRENSMNGNWVLIGNENSSAAADVYVEIGGKRMGDYSIPAGGRITPVFPNTMGGPVHVGCTSCRGDQKIMASQRVLYKDSFEEVQGTSPRDMGDGSVFTWYDLTPPLMKGDWILVGNQSAAADVYVQVAIGPGGAPMKMAGGGDTFVARAGGGSTTPYFPGTIGGPVNVTCTNCKSGEKLIISQRVIYMDSFNEVVGKPARK
ncbi:MAG: Ig-like domain-containing protein [Actinobacteria bacterium]|nr:Ig-like domain-containing protein [Actinomycetota bacterium]